MKDINGYYKLLNVKENATYNEIKLAFRNKAKKLHPDKNPDIDTTRDFQELNKAYETLSDENKRNDYDNELTLETNLNTSWEFPSFRQEVANHDFIKFNTNTTDLTCNCEDWKKNRKKYQYYDPRRLCNHLVAKFDIIESDEYRVHKLDLPEEFKPFEEYLIYRRSTYRGVKLFEEIVFFNSSIVVIDYNSTHIHLYLKKQLDDFCSYAIFQVHKYKGIGYKWMHNNNDEEILYQDNIDGKNYINKRFNVINKNVQLCNSHYLSFRYDEAYRIEKEFRLKYESTPNLLKQIKSSYNTRTFNAKLKEMGYITKTKDLNKNDWIIKDKGLNFGINYIGSAPIENSTVPGWYKTTSLNFNSMTIQHKNQTREVKKTNIFWEKEKFEELLKIMDCFKPIKNETIKNLKKEIREEWLKNISCPKCESKNIHKKDKRYRKEFQVQRYQCQDCKSIFQERIIKKEIEDKKTNIFPSKLNTKEKNFFKKVLNFFNMSK